MHNKLWYALFLLLVPFGLIGQAVTTYPGHPAYSTVKLRTKNCIEVQPNGSLVYIGYRDAGLHIFQTSTNSWTAYDTLNSNIPTNNVTAVKIANANQLWVGTKKGLAFFDGTTFSTYNTSNSAIVNDSITSLFVTTNGVWIGTKLGLSFFDGSSFTNYTSQNSGLVNNIINCIEQDSTGNFYFGTNEGLSYFDGTNWYNSTTANSGILNDTIKSVHYISSKACWIITQQGISKLTYGNFISFTDSTCIHPEYTSERHNKAFAIAKSDSLVYGYYNVLGFNSYTIPQKINEDNIVTQFNDTVINPPISHITTGAYSAVRNNILWTACYFSNTVLVKFDLAASTGSQLIAASPTSPQEILSGNLVTTTIYNIGDMFWDLMNYPKYEVPRCSGKHAMFAGGLWLGGNDQNGLLHTSAMTFRQNNARDYWSGPLDTISATTTVATVNAYNNIWKFEKDTINSFITNFLNGNVSNGTYPIPYDILTYPAVGTGNFTRNMAPYIDYNNDGNYNPYDGDYPNIKGNQHLYWIFNDNDTMHSETGGIPLKVEIHGSAYAYYCPQFSIDDIPGVVNYTTFYRYEIYNRSSNTYDSMYVGLWNEVDLGVYQDDYVGCDSTLNIGFGYNGDNNDDGAPWAYGLNPPMINCQILKGPEPDLNDGIDNDHDGSIDESEETNMMSSFLYYDGMGGVPTGYPSLADDYYQYMSSTYKDGTKITYGGNGYNPGSTNYTNYMFSGTPYSPLGWSESSEGNTAGDRRFIVASGPFSLAPGQMKSIDYAIVFTWDSTAANGLNTSIAKNIIGNQKIKQWFDAGVLGDCNVLSTENVFALPYWFQIFPNPANDVLQLVTNFSNNKTSSYTISDITGRVVLKNEFEDHSDISIKNLSPSIYLITVTNGNRILTRKFVKQ
jgi:hypothetical protein